MKILVTGSSGFIGRNLIDVLESRGDAVTRLIRSKNGAKPGSAYWNPECSDMELETLEDYDAVVHLAGESIAGRWTKEKKEKIENSRVKGTKLIAGSLAKLDNKPGVLIAASAIGIYGDRGDEILNESSSSGSGFLADVALRWEEALEPAAKAGIRVVKLRIGMVLGKDGGALGKMLLPFKIGMGGVIGSGNQYWSWISIYDLIGIILYAIQNKKLNGPINAITPKPVTNREFTKTLGRVLGRPTIFPLPAFVARGIMGEMARETMLASTRVVPEKLTAAGYTFSYPELENALTHILGANE